jgi:hypothetical protein
MGGKDLQLNGAIHTGYQDRVDATLMFRSGKFGVFAEFFHPRRDEVEDQGERDDPHHDIKDVKPQHGPIVVDDWDSKLVH